jgi:hypothetical protein
MYEDAYLDTFMEDRISGNNGLYPTENEGNPYDYARHFGEDECDEDEEEFGGDEIDDNTDDAYALASAGHGTDEDYYCGPADDY